MDEFEGVIRTPHYEKLCNTWHQNELEFILGDEKDLEIAERLVWLDNELITYERRYLSHIWGLLLTPKNTQAIAAEIHDLMKTEVARPGLDENERVILHEITEYIRLPQTIVRRREDREGTVNIAKSLLPLPLV